MIKQYSLMAKTTRTETTEDDSELVRAFAKPTPYICPLKPGLTVMLTPVFSNEPISLAGLIDIRREDAGDYKKGSYMNRNDHKGTLVFQCSYSGSVGPCCRHCEQVGGYETPPKGKD